MKWYFRTKDYPGACYGFISLSLAILIVFIEPSDAIKCYRCQVSPLIYRIGNLTNTIPLCSKFDESDEYITECEYSTMCVKKISRLYLQNGTVDTVTRGCASQKYTDQVLKQGAWRVEHKVEEPYKEGCEEFKENNLSGSSSTYCYCRGKLCNFAKKNDPTNSLLINAMIVIFVFNAFKCLWNGYKKI